MAFLDDMAYFGFMAEQEGLLDKETGKLYSNRLDTIAARLGRIDDPDEDDLREILIDMGISELSAEEMQYIGKKLGML